MLLLLGYKNGFQPKDGDRDLFNFFQAEIKKGQRSADGLFNELKQIKHTLNDWFEAPSTYNTLGFLLFAKHHTTKFYIKNLIAFFQKPKSELKKHLIETAIGLITTDLEQLEYGTDNDKINNVLLALNVFGVSEKFDFVSFKDNNWSLEHIFPQNPRSLPNKLGSKDILLISALLGNELSEPSQVSERLLEQMDEEGKEKIKSSIQSVKTKLSQDECILSEEEKVLIYKLMKTEKLNSMGNMALLNGPDNSSNSNGMFDRKRHNIVKRISEGSFVPKHTYDVFSKLLSNKMVPDLSVWTEKDIIAHQQWMTNRIKQIVSSN